MIKVIKDVLKKRITDPIDRNNIINLTKPENYSYDEIEDFLDNDGIDESILCEAALNIIINFSEHKNAHNIFSHIVNHPKTKFSNKSIKEIKISFLYWNKPEFEVYFIKKENS